jgi:hypothetical protein
MTRLKTHSNTFTMRGATGRRTLRQPARPIFILGGDADKWHEGLYRRNRADVMMDVCPTPAGSPLLRTLHSLTLPGLKTGVLKPLRFPFSIRLSRGGT